MAKNIKKAQKSKRAQKKAVKKRSAKETKVHGPKGKKHHVIGKHLRPRKEKVAKFLNKKEHERFGKEGHERICIVTGKPIKRKERIPRDDTKNDDEEMSGEDSTAQMQDDGEGSNEEGSEQEGDDNSSKNLETEEDDAAVSQLHAAFGKKLSHTEKSIRDKGFKALQKWLRKKGSELDTMEFVKLWKALWYCLWMSDKKPVQQDLSVQMAKLAASIPKEKLADWFGSFMEVMTIEWKNLDQWRLNKFLLMIRIQVAEIFRLVDEEYKWNEDLIEEINETLLSVSPLCAEGHFNPGLTAHFALVFWEELKFQLPKEKTEEEKAAEDEAAKAAEESEKAGKKSKKKGTKVRKGKATEKTGDVHALSDPAKKEETLMHLMEPFFQVLVDSSFPDQVHRAIVKEILGPKLPAYMRKPVSEELLSIAEDAELPQAMRKKLTAICTQLDNGVEDVELPSRNVHINPRLEAPQKKLRRGLGVRTRGQRKVRQRDRR